MAGGFGAEAVAVAVKVVEGAEGAVVHALGLGAAAQVGAELNFLFLDEGFGNAGFSATVVASEIIPELLVDAADAEQFPIRAGEFFDEDSLVGVLGLVGLDEAAAEVF